VEVHVRPWPALDADYVVSTDGGEEPARSHDGKEISYRRRNEMMAIAVTTSSIGLGRGVPRSLFARKFRKDPCGGQSYDVAADGRFLMLRPVSTGRVEIGVALNWIAEVPRQLDQAQ
jgi:hypothetical protein